ncbi:MAG: hypothetical protein LBM04_03120 [Opitutaceae bacterium]|nr:hypothetical protein [Opitutaceae bacterium]
MKIHILHNRNHRGLFRHLLVACLVSTRMLPSAPAQQTPGTSSPDEDEIVMMTPFEVSAEKDYGYQATSTLAGGRIETSLKDTPASISILTKEFMDDLALTSTQDFAMWSVSSEASDPGSSFSDDFQISTRGLGNNVFGSRNYFRFYGNSDSFNVESLEFSRGPNAMLFGESTLGGVTTTWTKQAKFRRRIATLQMRVDSEGSYRASMDYNYSPTKTFAVRLNTLYADTRFWRDAERQTQKDVHLAVSYALTKNTQLRAEYQHSEKKRTAPFNPFVDQVSNWNGDPANINGAGTAAMASADVLVWNAALPEQGVMNWNGARRTAGTGLYMSTDPRPGIARFPTVPSREFNTNAPSSSGLFKTDTASVYLDRKIGKNLFVQAAYNYTKPYKTLDEVRWYTMYIDLNDRLPGGDPNPFHLQPYGEANPIGRKQSNEVNEYRLLATWKFENSWTRQAFTVLANYRTDNYTYKQIRYVPNGIKSMNGTEITPYSSNNANDGLRIRRYWTALGPDSRPQSVTNAYGTFPFEYREYSTTYEENEAVGVQISNVGQYFGGSLNIIMGYRYDQAGKTAWRTSERNPDGSTSAFDETQDPDSTAHSPSIGAVWWLLKKGLGLSFNYAENYRPATAGYPDINGNSMGITTGKGIDAGLRFTIPGGKFYGSLNYYDSNSFNAPVSPSVRTNIANAINNIWTQMDGTDPVSGEFRDTTRTTGHGWELEITYSPLKRRNWQMRLAGNLPYAEQYAVWPTVKNYIAANRPAWEAYINDESQGAEARQSAALSLLNLDSLLAINAAENVRRSGSVQWKANYFTSYRFLSGALRGLTVGGGAVYTGKRVIAVREEDKSIIWSDGTLLFNLLFKYECKVAKKTMILQLNIDNLLDNDQLDFRTVKVYNGLYYYDRYNYLTPRKLSLSAIIRF